nr:MAG TPA: hypothetical protein [Caudoviricetes sp.]
MDKLNNWLRNNYMNEVEPLYIDGSTVVQLPEIGNG